jgi:hypothetical protein
VPFVQGHLRSESLTVEVETECGHCREPLHIAIDSDLDCSVEEAGAEPLVYVPLLDLRNLDEPSIIDRF